MNTKHKNYEWIVAFAEGKVVECKGNTPDYAWNDWAEVKSLDVFDDRCNHLIYRLKPEEAQKSVGYRRFLYKCGGVACVGVAVEGIYPMPKDVKNLIREIDTEWQYEPVKAPAVNKIEQGKPIPVLVGEIPCIFHP